MTIYIYDIIYKIWENDTFYFTYDKHVHPSASKQADENIRFQNFCFRSNSAVNYSFVEA